VTNERRGTGKKCLRGSGAEGASCEPFLASHSQSVIGDDAFRTCCCQAGIAWGASASHRRRALFSRGGDRFGNRPLLTGLGGRTYANSRENIEGSAFPFGGGLPVRELQGRRSRFCAGQWR
jgi:hypothetical protein